MPGVKIISKILIFKYIIVCDFPTSLPPPPPPSHQAKLVISIIFNEGKSIVVAEKIRPRIGWGAGGGGKEVRSVVGFI